MTLEHKTPKARKAALGYCRRCLAVMLCCVLVFGLTVRTAPRAKADAATAALIASLGLSAYEATSFTLGMYGLAGSCGLDVKARNDFEEGVANLGYFGSVALLRLAQQLVPVLETLEEVGTEWASFVQSYVDKGGLSAGESVTFPAEISDAIRSWAVENFDFSNGAYEVEDGMLVAENGRIIVFTEAAFTGFAVNPDMAGYGLISNRGSIYACDVSVTINGISFVVKVEDEKKWLYINSTVVYNSTYYASQEPLGLTFCVATYNDVQVLVPCLVFYQDDPDTASTDNVAYVMWPCANSLASYDVENFGTTGNVTTAITSDNDMATPIVAPITVTVPLDATFANVDDVAVPVVGDIAAEDLLNPTIDNVTDNTTTGITAGEIAGAIAEALPITGALAGDQVVEEVAQDPDSLGAVFISKFPFCIPWDIVQAVKLLAADPVTPRWEMDLYGPLQGKWGFHAETTSVVIDLEPLEPAAVVVRWVTTIMFIYALASGTKKLIWTA